MTRRPVPFVHRLRLGVFTAPEALQAGWSTSALERAVASGWLIRLRRGVYVEAGLDAELHPADQARRFRARCSIAAALVTTGGTVTALSSGTLLGWPVWAPRERACVNVANSRSPSMAGVHLHRGAMLPHSWSEVAGFRMTRPTRTVIDVAREFGTEAGLVVADTAMATGATTVAMLERELGRLIGRRGVGNVRPLPGLVDPRSESPLESRSRWKFVVHDLPAPQSQTWIYDLNGRFLGRSDFYWGAGVVGEVDGAGKLVEQSDRKALLERQLLFTRAGLRITRWGHADLRAFGPTEAWIRTELAAADADSRPRGWIASPERLGSRSPVWPPRTGDSDPSRQGWGA